MLLQIHSSKQRRNEMTHKFKVGDKVRCTDDSGFAEGILTQGDTYTVQFVSKLDTICVKGEDDIVLSATAGPLWFEVYRFKLLEQPEAKTEPVKASPLEFKYKGKVYQGVEQSGCDGCAFQTSVPACRVAGQFCSKDQVIWVEKKSEPKPNEQIVHCRSIGVGVRRTTWVFSESDKGQKYVDVQYAVCHPGDQYIKKIGVWVAKSKPKVTVLKGEVPKYVKSIRPSEDDVWLAYPDIYQIYQAICHLVK
jgi:hypothetical protein